MKTTLPKPVFFLIVSLAATPGQLHAADANASKPIKLLSKIGDWHRPVTTTNKMAQHFFDQGLTLVYGFNHDAAIRSFKRALEFDPNLAMAHWGIGYALGPNINVDVDPEREKAAFEEAQKALSLADKAGEEERAYIFALTNRYSLDPKADLRALQVEFKNAMAEVAARYPDDLDAVTLYAESMMNLQPWDMWTGDGKPKGLTTEIVALLESVMRRDPNHPGANHYYIHAVEASPNPERALPSAERLEKLVPVAGHLVHMPAHIYIRTGNYAAAARRNEVAAAADKEYISACGVKGVYPLLYYSHNLHFLAVAQMLQGRYGDAMKAADKLVANVPLSAVKDIPDLEGFLPTPTLLLVAFHRWSEVLKLAKPDASLKQTTTIWHFARGMAFAATGKVSDAEEERQRFLATRESIPTEGKYSPLNKAHDVLKIAELQLGARIAQATGDSKTAIDLLRQAAEGEDALRYFEPPDWYIYSREALGAVLMKAGDYARAEQVFRDDLQRNPLKGRALFGLQASLQAQGKTSAANFVKRGFKTAWQDADTELKPPATW